MYCSYHNLRNSSKAISCWSRLSRTSFLSISLQGSSSKSLKTKEELLCIFKKELGEITFKSFSESLYVRGLEFIASCIEDKVVSNSVRINLSQAAPMKAA